MTHEEELKQVLNETGKTITALRSTIDKLEAEGKAKNGEFKEFEKKTQDALDALDSKREKLEKDLTEERRKATLVGQEIKDINGERAPEGYSDAKKAFENFCRTGSNDGSDTQRESKTTFAYRNSDGTKAASVLSDPAGGYTVMRDFSAQIMRKVFETSPMLQHASVETVGSDRLEGIISAGEGTSGWVGEIESRTETTTQEIGEWSIPVREIYSMPRCTQKLLDDSSWNYEQFLIDEASKQIARAINTATLTANTAKRPRGILTYPAGTSFTTQIEQVNMLDANLITADGLIKVQESLKDNYRGNAKWFFNRQTRRAIRTLKDSYGQYLLQPGLSMGAPSELLGDPMVIFQDMADVAANALAVMYGDMKEGYKVVERQGFRVLRDPYTVKGSVLFYITRRCGGDAWNKEAIIIGKVAA